MKSPKQHWRRRKPADLVRNPTKRLTARELSELAKRRGPPPKGSGDEP